MARRNFFPSSNDSKTAILFGKATHILLCFQIIATALYYNGWILPLDHKILLGQFLALTAWLCYLLHSLFAKRFVLASSPYYLPAGLLCLWAGFRAFTAPNQEAVSIYYMFITICSTFPLWVTNFRQRYFVNLFLWTAFIAGVLMTVGCLRQLSTKDPGFSWPFFEAVTLSPGSYDRQNLGSFMGHNNHATAYIAYSAIVSGLFWILYRRFQWSLLFGVYILISLVMIYLGGSRGVVLMTLAALTVLTIGLFKTRLGSIGRQTGKRLKELPKSFGIWGISLSVAAIIFFVLLLKFAPLQEKGYQNVFKRFLTKQEDMISGTYPRVWTMSLLMARYNPVMGVGFSAWPFIYPTCQEQWFTRYPHTSIGLPEINKHTLRGHNDYLQLWAELGTVGLFLMLWLIFVHVKTFLLILQKKTRSPITLFVYAATIAMMAEAIFGFPFHIGNEGCLFIGFLALVSSRAYQKVWRWEPAWMKSPWKQGRAGAVLGIVAIFCMLYSPIVNTILGYHISRQDGIYKVAAADKPEHAARYYDSAYISLEHSFKYLPHHGMNLYTYGIDTYNRGILAHNKELILKGIEAIEHSKVNYSIYKQYTNLGDAYRALWKLDPQKEYLEIAIKNYEKAGAIMPIDEDIWLQLVLLYSDNGQEQKRLEVLGGTEIRFPGFIERKFPGAALEAEKYGDIQSAANLYALAMLIEPENPELFNAMMLFYLRIDRLDMAASMLIQLAKHQPPESFNHWMSAILVALLDKQNIHGAYTMMSQLCQVQEIQDNPDLWYYSGFVSWIAGHSWDSVHFWTGAQEHGVAYEQVEQPLSIIFDQIYQPLTIR